MNHIIILWSALGIYQILGSIGLISSLVVVSAKNPIHRIAALIIVFLVGALMFMHLDYYFLGLTYIIVYVGAIAILFLFVIMMVPVYPVTAGHPVLTDKNNILRILNTPNQIITPNSIITPNLIVSLMETRNSALWFRKNNLIQSIVPNDLNLNGDVNKADYSHILGDQSNYHHTLTNVHHITQVQGSRVNNYDTLGVNNILTGSYNNPKLIQTNYKLGIQSQRYIILCIGILLLLILPIHMSYISDSFWLELETPKIWNFLDSQNFKVYSYFYPSWVIEYKTLTDIETLAILIYVAYPTALLLIGTALWTVMIGIISICSPRNQ